MRDAFVARLHDEAARDDRVFLITGDLGFGVLTGYAERYPRQYLNIGVAEQNMTGVATGLALGGRIVFTYSIANFPTIRCLEQVRNDAAYHSANVKIVAIGGGFSYGALGMSHHATEDLAILRAIPNITVVAPGCLWEVEEAVSALVKRQGTCYLRLDKSNAGRTNRSGEQFELGRMRVLRPGQDISIIATGGILECALRAADILAADGVDCRVISAHTLRPFDTETLFAACQETHGVLTVEEHVADGGLGALVAETCLEGNIVPRTFERIAMRGGFSSIVGSQAYLRRRHGLDEESIVKAGRRMMESARGSGVGS